MDREKANIPIRAGANSFARRPHRISNRPMNEKFLNWLVLILAASAATTTGLVVKRELQMGPTRAAPTITSIDSWRRLSAATIDSDESRVPVTLVAFVDYQCPFCKGFAESIRLLRAKYGDSVSVVVRHFPLESIHPHAFDAALAAECARNVGRFEAMERALYQNQDSIGKNDWSKFAEAAEIDDTFQLESCVRDSVTVSRVRNDIALANELGVRGTPTVLVNEFLIPWAPAFRTLDSLTAVILLKRKS